MCGEGRLSIKLGRYGAFVGCSNYPDCRYTRPLGVRAEESAAAAKAKERVLGVDPETAEEIRLQQGPYGLYLQRGSGENVKRGSLPPNLDPADLDLETARALLALPREIGRHPETGKPIEAGINRYGPYIKHDRFVRLGPDDDVLSIGMNRAMALIDEAKSRGRGGPQTLKELGAHPRDGKPVTVQKGRFGPYVKHGGTNASLPKALDAGELTMDAAVELLDKRAAKGKGRGKAAKAGAGTKAGPAKGKSGSGAKSRSRKPESGSKA